MGGLIFFEVGLARHASHGVLSEEGGILYVCFMKRYSRKKHSIHSPLAIVVFFLVVLGSTEYD